METPRARRVFTPVRTKSPHRGLLRTNPRRTPKTPVRIPKTPVGQWISRYSPRQTRSMTRAAYDSHNLEDIMRSVRIQSPRLTRSAARLRDPFLVSADRPLISGVFMDIPPLRRRLPRQYDPDDIRPMSPADNYPDVRRNLRTTYIYNFKKNKKIIY
jgi:hypothetical protein